jgi:transposase InsO family protein
VTDILRRAGLVDAVQRRRRPEPHAQPFAAVAGANDTWCIDFKGWFRTRDGERCDPLTVTDAHSRYLLAVRIMPERSEPVRAAMDEVFGEYGLPLAMRSDNGSPFASIGAAGLSVVSVHWAKLGIRLERIVPGHPQQNGRHERMHRTLKAETTRPPAASLAEQQGRFDRFRADYNHHRPHEALGQQPPAEHYRASPRQLPTQVPEPWYDADHAVRRVRPTGEIKWGGASVFISQALAGEPVGIAEAENGDWLVRFAALDLGIIERRTNKLIRFGAGRPVQQPCSAGEASGT